MFNFSANFVIWQQTVWEKKLKIGTEVQFINTITYTKFQLSIYNHLKIIYIYITILFFFYYYYLLPFIYNSKRLFFFNVYNYFGTRINFGRYQNQKKQTDTQTEWLMLANDSSLRVSNICTNTRITKKKKFLFLFGRTG